MKFFGYINRIYEKNLLMLAGVIAMSPVTSCKLNIILIEMQNDVKFCHDCSIITRWARMTQDHEKSSGPWKSQGLD
jgi:hypothetical protein